MAGKRLKKADRLALQRLFWAWLHHVRGLSRSEIGRLVGGHPSTVRRGLATAAYEAAFKRTISRCR
jgi:hypothetical protein